MMTRGGLSFPAVVLAVAAAFPADALAQDLAGLLDSYRALAPAPDGFAAAGKTVEIGRLSLELLDGGLYPVRGKRDELLGVYFEGRGRYAYRSDDPRDRTVLAGNVARNAPHLTLRESTVRDSFERFVLFFARPALEDQLVGSPVPLPDGGRAEFDRMWKRVGLTHLEYDHLTAEARLNGGDLQYVYAEIEGAGAVVGYTYDRVRSFIEGLVTFQRYPGVDFRFSVRLSAQDLARPEDGLATASVRHARVAVATDDNRGGSIDSELTIEPAKDGLRVVPFLLLNNRARYSWDWAAEDKRLDVQRVTGPEGQELAFSHRYHELLVELPAPSKRGERITLRVETEGEVLTGMGYERSEDYFSLFGEAWFPHALRWDAGAYTFDLTARTRKPFYPVASGTTTVREEGEFYVLESKSERPVDRVALFAGKYKNIEQMAGPVRVRVHGYLTMSKQLTETLPGLVSELLRFYGDQLGPYPFEELDVVGTPAHFVGIAPSGMVLLPEGTYKPMAVEEHTQTTRYLVRGAPPLIAHEVAHQWFGHRVAPSAPEETWLSESFSEYLSGLAMGAGETKVHRVVGFKEMLDQWRAAARECADVGSLESASALGGEQGWEDRFCLLYNRGPLVLHMFRTTVGDKNFFTILRKLLDRADYGPATTEDLKQVVKETLRDDMGWFFDQWVTQSGIPTIDVEHGVMSPSAGRFALTGKVRQPIEGFKKMIIPFVVEYPGGNREAKLVFQEKPVQEFGFALAGKPSSVKLDPSNNNLAVYR
jgi:hypothetical protein